MRLDRLDCQTAWIASATTHGIGGIGIAADASTPTTNIVIGRNSYARED